MGAFFSNSLMQGLWVVVVAFLASHIDCLHLAPEHILAQHPTKELQAGEHVTLVGLKAEKFNGKDAVILKRAERKDRYIVMVDDNMKLSVDVSNIHADRPQEADEPIAEVESPTETNDQPPTAEQPTNMVEQQPIVAVQTNTENNIPEPEAPSSVIVNTEIPSVETPTAGIPSTETPSVETDLVSQVKAELVMESAAPVTPVSPMSPALPIQTQTQPQPQTMDQSESAEKGKLMLQNSMRDSEEQLRRAIELQETLAALRAKNDVLKQKQSLFRQLSALKAASANPAESADTTQTPFQAGSRVIIKDLNGSANNGQAGTVVKDEAGHVEVRLDNGQELVVEHENLEAEKAVAVGATVRLKSLTVVEYNGQVGKVSKERDQNTGRYEVIVGAERLAVKPENVEVIQEPEVHVEPQPQPVEEAPKDIAEVRHTTNAIPVQEQPHHEPIPYGPGARVIVQGLNQNVELNGLRGSVVANLGGDRFEVEIQDHGKHISIQGDHLRPEPSIKGISWDGLRIPSEATLKSFSESELRDVLRDVILDVETPFKLNQRVQLQGVDEDLGGNYNLAYGTVVKTITPKGHVVVRLDDGQTVLHVDPSHLRIPASPDEPEPIAEVATPVTKDSRPQIMLSNAPPAVARRQAHLQTGSWEKYFNMFGQKILENDVIKPSEDTIFEFVDRATPIGTRVRLLRNGWTGHIVAKEGREFVVELDSQGRRRVAYTELELENVSS